MRVESIIAAGTSLLSAAVAAVDRRALDACDQEAYLSRSG
jgi:hypothetical protein